jgi:type VI secretion system protein
MGYGERMALRLRIISDHRRLLGERGTVIFGVGGGTIGRSADNDWVLPDPQRYVSAHHARISQVNGQYILEDLSTNGVFVNDDERPLAKQGGPYMLQNGDLLRLGDYQVVVSFDAAPLAASAAAVAAAAVSGATARAATTANGATATTGGTDQVPTHIDVLESIGRASQTDLGAQLNLNDLLMTEAEMESPSGSRFRPVNAYGQTVPAPRAPSVAPTLPAPAPPPSPAPTQTSAEEAAVARRIERLSRAAAKARDARTTGPALYDVQSGLQAFCRGAGIDAEKLPPDAQTRLMHLVGQLMREALVGLKDLERTRHEMHNRFRVVLETDPNDPRPSLERASIEELLIQILAQHESRRIDAVQWLRETLGAAKQHEQATTTALRAAFVDFVGRFDPEELVARFQRARRSKLIGNAESQYWALFVDFYRNLTEMPADHLPHSFVEAFAQAYCAALLAPRESE